MIAIKCEGLSKRYRIGERESYKALRDVLTDVAATPFRRMRGALGNGHSASPNNDKSRNTIWALDDVSFEVNQGEVVGIIGRNGAGKSTLLKILSRITKPTRGHAEINGRVGSLLEVGTGFHPELTGRENIYLNGAILGMRRAEIDRKFDEIVAFAEVEKFIDTPVKRYSSGMYVRLAFAVAAHMETDNLLVDEVLSVGDVSFQEKCLGKMGEVAKHGRTVLFVSHNLEAVSALTSRCILLKSGTIAHVDSTSRIISKYLHDASSHLDYESEPSPFEPRITEVRVLTSQPDNIQVHGEAMEVHIEISSPEPIAGCRIALRCCDSFQRKTLYSWIYDSERPICRTAGKHRLVCQIPKLRLYRGRYTLQVHLSEHYGGKHFQVLEGLCPFDVIIQKSREGGYGPDEGVYVEECNWIVESEPLTQAPSQRQSDTINRETLPHEHKWAES